MWYALVQDEQLGPMPDSELVELYLKGVVADQTLVWNANLPDWKPFSEVPDLMELAGGEELEAEEEGDGATIMMADDANWAALLAQGRPPVQVSRSQPLPDARSSISMVAPRDVPTSERLQPPAGLGPQQAPVGRSGMFQAVQEPARPAPPPEPAPEPEDLGGFGGFGGFDDAPAPPVDLGDLPLEEPGRTAAPGFTSAALTPPPKGGRTGLVIALVVLVVGGLGAAGTVWYLRQGAVPARADAGVAAAMAPDAEPVVVPSPDAALPPPDAAAPPPVDAAVPDAATDAMVFALLEVPDPRRRRPRRPPAPASRAPAARAPAAAPRTQAPKPPPAGDLPRQLGRQDMLDVIQANAGRLKSCADADPNAKGTFTVAVTINRTGAVQQAKVVTARLRGSAATACIEGQIKSYKFKPFAGDPMRLQIPFKI
ncbi:MAG: DUF4339 domain-containing protein [Myxococcales bacterium]|nr:DUF4339 domain-containing protein [Myxococcales bacterium]